VRWIWFDRFEVFESGRRAVAVKNVSLAEDHLHDHFPGFPIMPASLMIEGMAQTAGILVGEARQFAEKVILAKIKRAAFSALVRPGDQVRYSAEIEQISESAASTLGRVTRGPELIGEVDIVFSHIDQNMSGLQFPQENFVFTPEFMALLSTYRSDPAARISL
jgi:3-hydroxyacyl-[acyl-carrier-protein] dehydratase